MPRIACIVSPAAINKQIRTRLYADENTPCAEKIIKGHIFGGSCDWYLTEYNEEDDLAFGFCHLGDDQCAEWGYVSLTELREYNATRSYPKMEWDRYWNKKPANQIEKIVRCGGC